MTNIYHSKLIDDLGGTGVVAALCGLTSQAISKWRRLGIPKPWIKYLRSERPEVFSKYESEQSKEAA